MASCTLYLRSIQHIERCKNLLYSRHPCQTTLWFFFVSFFLLGTLKQEGEDCGPCWCPPKFNAGECAPGLYCDLSIQYILPDKPGKCRPTKHEGGFPYYSGEWDNYNYQQRQLAYSYQISTARSGFQTCMKTKTISHCCKIH